jgi:GDPmannose 4,6-dehydratase
MQWLMLQQDKPEDFVIATGRQYSVRDFVNAVAGELGMTLRWQGAGVDETGIIDTVDSSKVSESESPLKPGDTIVRVDSRYFRPTEVETLLGDPSKAKTRLGWEPRVDFEGLVQEMVREDLMHAERDKLCDREGFATYNRHE